MSEGSATEALDILLRRRKDPERIREEAEVQRVVAIERLSLRWIVVLLHEERTKKAHSLLHHPLSGHCALPRVR